MLKFNHEDYKVFDFSHVDDQEMFIDFDFGAYIKIMHLEETAEANEKEFNGDDYYDDYKAFEAHLEAEFIKHGWETDGVITYFWIPVFLLETSAEGYSNRVGFHVKQNNNGISYIAVPERLNLPTN